MVKEKNQLNEYKYPVIAVSGSLLLGVLLLFFVGRPVYNGIREVNYEIDEKRTVLEKKEEKLENLKKLSEREEEIKRENEIVLAALPEDREVSRLFVQFERIASDSGLSIQSINEKAETQAADTSQSEIQETSYRVVGTAENYDSLKETLSRMETALRVLSVSDLDVSYNEGDRGLNLTMFVKTYKRGLDE